MPKAPILNRECFYERIHDGTYRDLDWNLVNTELGAMVEPRNINAVGVDNIALLNMVDTSFNRRTEMREDQFNSTFGTTGRQLPIDF